MKRKQDEFACVNHTKKTGNMIVFAIAVLAICISGVLCVKKLRMEEKYISKDTKIYKIDKERALIEDEIENNAILCSIDAISYVIDIPYVQS